MKNHNFLKIPFACLASILLFASCSQPPNTVRGHIVGLTNDTVMVIAIPLYDFGGPAASDTLFAKNGQFEYQFPGDGAYDLLIGFAQFPLGEASVVHVFVVPDDRISFKCQTNSKGMSSIEMSGSKVNIDYAAIQNKEYEIFRPQLEISSALDQAIAGNNEEAKKIEYAKRSEMFGLRDKLFLNYVKDNLDNPLSAWLLSFQPLDSIAFYYDKLGENARNSIFRQMIDREMERYTRFHSINGVGSRASDFALGDISGKPFSLSSIAGKDKYVILDFWGSWCGPCVKGMPTMKSFYAKHREKLEIVGVACDESSGDVWRGAVQQLGLPWINVCNDDGSAVNKKYGVKAYPTKIVIDPEGTIVIKEEGESEDFYKKLETLLNE